MLTLLIATILAASTQDTAETPASAVAELRLPQRGLSIEAFVRIGAGGEVFVERDTLAALTLTAPLNNRDEWIALSAIGGLRIQHDDASTAYVLTCATQCFDLQVLNADQDDVPPLSASSGVYLNYDLEALKVDADNLVAGVGELNVFNPWGVGQTSWTAASAGDARGLVRLETSWTVDNVAKRLQLRLGDSVASDAAGSAFRFVGVQFGSASALTPTWITYPTPVFGGIAQGPSSVALFVDGALRARENINTGPFQIDNTPLVNGAGDAQLVVTDTLGRQQVISTPFYLNAALLRPGLSDWRVNAGVARNAYGRKSFDYNGAFFSGDYRRGISDALTLEMGADYGSGDLAIRMGADAGHPLLGQIHVARAQEADGSSSTMSWSYDAHAWSIGVESEQRDGGYRGFADGIVDFRGSVSGHVGINLGIAGNASAAIATIERAGNVRESVLTFDYTPDLRLGSLSFRALYTEGESHAFAFGISFTAQLRGDRTGSLSYDTESRGLRASVAQDEPASGGLRWRAGVATGDADRVALAASLRGALGEATAEVQSANGVTGIRASQIGSVGFVDGTFFAGPRIDGAFAVVDAGAPDVSVYRNGHEIGRTNSEGRVLATNLQPYAANRISINADDLPLDRAPASTDQDIAPPQSAGAVVRFTQANESVAQSNVRFENGQIPARGSLLVRERDGAHFPIGEAGRVAIMGARAGDMLVLSSDEHCSAVADAHALQSGLVVQCRRAA